MQIFMILYDLRIKLSTPSVFLLFLNLMNKKVAFLLFPHENRGIKEECITNLVLYFIIQGIF